MSVHGTHVSVPRKHVSFGPESPFVCRSCLSVSANSSSFALNASPLRQTTLSPARKRGRVSCERSAMGRIYCQIECKRITDGVTDFPDALIVLRKPESSLLHRLPRPGSNHNRRVAAKPSPDLVGRRPGALDAGSLKAFDTAERLKLGRDGGLHGPFPADEIAERIFLRSLGDTTVGLPASTPCGWPSRPRFPLPPPRRRTALPWKRHPPRRGRGCSSPRRSPYRRCPCP